MPVLNGGFETAGTEPGSAAHWRLRSLVRGRSIASFGPAPHRAWEDFERWHAPVELTLAAVTVAVFEPRREAFDALEAGWGNDLFAFELPEGSMASASFGGAPVESLALGWGTEAYATDWTEVSATIAAFDGGPAEAFERRWRGNELFVLTWDDVVSTGARFDTAGEERFDGVWERTTSI